MACTNLYRVTIPSSVTSIGSAAFDNCTRLTNITISSLVTSIGENAFAGCSNLVSFTIPGSVINIGNYAFLYCWSLTNIAVDAQNANYSSFNGVLFDKKQTTLVEYPGGKRGSYVIPGTVTNIGYTGGPHPSDRETQKLS
jgi:hypothetical protein